MSSTETLAIKPEIIEWACARSGKSRDDLRANFPRLDEWACGAASPTIEDLKQFADATYTGFGEFFGPETPCDELPIPDLRSSRGGRARQPSPHLMQTVYDCQFRQEMYSEYIAAEEGRALNFAGAAEVGDQVQQVAQQCSEIGGFNPTLWGDAADAGDALQMVADAVRDAGVLVFFGGIVGTDAARLLDPEEFRGFALADPIAPAIFVNSRCGEAEQMFMLAHEFAHIIAGESGVSDASMFDDDAGRIERWCAELASELLIPLDDLHEQVQGWALDDSELGRLARRYCVNRRLVIERLQSAGLIAGSERYEPGGDEHLQMPSGAECDDVLARVGRRYARAVVYGIRTGAAAYTDIDYLLGIRSLDLFDQIASEVGLAR